MYRMIIVDDNPWDCKGIQSVIDWNALGIEIVGSYSNGQKALDKIDEVKPHIVLTDVAMPVMDGIDLAKTLKGSYPEIKVIFLSSYDDFNFARSAINLDIFGYVLKPVVPQELIKTISKVINRNEIENLQKEEKEKMLSQINASLPLVQEEFLREMLFGLYGSMDDIMERTEFLSLQIHLNEDASIWILLMEINNYEEITEGMDMTGKYLASYTIKEIILSLGNSNCVIYPVGISPKEIACIIFYTDKKVNTKKIDIINKTDQIIDTAVTLHNKINEKLKLDIKIGISLNSQNPVDIHKLYIQAREALQTKFYGICNPIVLYHDIENRLDGLSEENFAIEALYRDVKNVLFEENTDITQLLDKYLGHGSIKYSEKYIRGLAFSIINTMQIVLMDTELSFRDILGSEMLVWEKLYRFETILDIRQWLANLFNALKEYINKNTSRNARIVEDIKNIIKQRYNEQLTINSIAEAIYLSPSHANRIFKYEMGISIFDYLIQYRIDMAKNMLKDPYVKVYQIAEKVGYTSTAHFCLIFKKYTGISPASYRQHTGLE